MRSPRATTEHRRSAEIAELPSSSHEHPPGTAAHDADPAQRPAAGTPAKVKRTRASLTGRYLRGQLDIELPPEMQRAGHLFGRKLGGNGRKFLLIGHLDTVFEADDDFQAFTRDGDQATGPGVDDMKAGNVVIVYALKALAEIGALDNIPVVVAYTGDEEKTGSPLWS